MPWHLPVGRNSRRDRKAWSHEFVGATETPCALVTDFDSGFAHGVCAAQYRHVSASLSADRGRVWGGDRAGAADLIDLHGRDGDGADGLWGLGGSLGASSAVVVWVDRICPRHSWLRLIRFDWRVDALAPRRRVWWFGGDGGDASDREG